MSNTSSSKVFLVFLVIAALIVVGVVAWTATQTETTEDATTLVTNDVTDNDNFNDPTNDDSTNAPQTNEQPSDQLTNTPTAVNLTLLQAATTTQVGDITTYTFPGNNIVNVMPADMQSLVLNETPVTERISVTVDGVAGERLTISSAKDGSDVTIIQVVSGDWLYDFRGDNEFLTNLENYITFN